MVPNNILKTVSVFFVLAILIFSEVGFIVAQNVPNAGEGGNVEIGLDAGEDNNNNVLEDGGELGILNAKNKGFSSIIDTILDCLLDPLGCLELIIELPVNLPGFPGGPNPCENNRDCKDIGFKDPAPYCDGNVRVIPKVFCFNRRTSEAFCGIHNVGINRRKCARNAFCRELDVNNDGIIESVTCVRGVNCNGNGICEYGEGINCIDCIIQVPPQRPPNIPGPGPPFPHADPNPPQEPENLACNSNADCNLLPGDFKVSCQDRDGDGTKDELVRKRACCSGIGANKICGICEDRVSNCRYGCGWRTDMNPPRTFCCTRNNPCGEPSCNNDGICGAMEVPGTCADCDICNTDGVCDRERGENANNCEDCQGEQIDCCIDSDCGERKYECQGNTVVWTFPRCKKVCTPESECSEGFAKTDCSILGKICIIKDNGMSGCVDSNGAGMGNLAFASDLDADPNQNNNFADAQKDMEMAVGYS